MPAPEDIPDDFLEIDPLKIDEEWRNQAQLYFKWAKRLARSRKKVLEAKASLDLVRAELDRMIRTDPAEYHLEKVTEETVKNCILTCAGYKEANKDYIQAKYQEELHEAAVRALEHRREGLENEVKLQVNTLHSEPRAPKGMRQEVNEMQRNNTMRRGARRRSGE